MVYFAAKVDFFRMQRLMATLQTYTLHIRSSSRKNAEFQAAISYCDDFTESYFSSEQLSTSESASA